MAQLSEEVVARRGGLSEELIAKRRRAGSDPVRQRIMERFYEDRDWTAKELAESLRLGANGLYYHLRILEDAELIVAAGGRPGPRGLEKTYRRAENQHIDWELDEDLVMAFASLLEAAKHDVAEAVYDAATELEDDADQDVRPVIDVSAPAFTTTRAEIVEFATRLRDLVGEFRSRAEDLRGMQPDKETPWRRLKFTYALYERPAAPV